MRHCIHSPLEQEVISNTKAHLRIKITEANQFQGNLKLNVLCFFSSPSRPPRNENEELIHREKGRPKKEESLVFQQNEYGSSTIVFAISNLSLGYFRQFSASHRSILLFPPK